MTREEKLLRESVKLARKGKKRGYSVPVDLPEGFRLDREGNLILPRSAGLCADLLYKVREARLKLQHETEKFERAESALREYFINNLSKTDATGCAGAVARVQIEVKMVPQVSDWEAFYEHIRRTKNFELLQRRVSESAVVERWEDKKTVPGVVAFQAKKVSVTKL